MCDFLTPDWSESPEAVPYAELSDPQTLNLYVYGRNNPVTDVDADGHTPIDWIWEQSGYMQQEVGFGFHLWGGAAAGRPDPSGRLKLPGYTVTVRGTPIRLHDLSFAVVYGHHGLSRWSKVARDSDAYRFFRRWFTGPLENPEANYFDALHRAYNDAIEELVGKLSKQWGVDLAEMSPAQIRQLARAVLSSSDPRIQDFLTRLEQMNAGSVGRLSSLIDELDSLAPVLLSPGQAQQIRLMMRPSPITELRGDHDPAGKCRFVVSDFCEAGRESKAVQGGIHRPGGQDGHRPGLR